jgi:hypothetical protein
VRHVFLDASSSCLIELAMYAQMLEQLLHMMQLISKGQNYTLYQKMRLGFLSFCSEQAKVKFIHQT